MSDQPQPPKQHTTRDILADLPNVRQLALRPLARIPLLAVVLEQARALDEIAGWAAASEQIAAAEALPVIDATNGHAELPKDIAAARLVPSRQKGGG